MPQNCTLYLCILKSLNCICGGTIFFFVEEQDRKQFGSEFPRVCIVLTVQKRKPILQSWGWGREGFSGQAWRQMCSLQFSRKTEAGWEIEGSQDFIGPPKTERNFKITMRQIGVG